MNVSEYIEGARNRLIEFGWVTGSYGSKSSGYCSMGAINAEGGSVLRTCGFDTADTARREAVKMVATQLQPEWMNHLKLINDIRVAEGNPQVGEMAYAEMAIIHMNDRLDKDKVLQAFSEAADAARLSEKSDVVEPEIKELEEV